MKKRIIAIIMTAALILALLPATALAAGTVLTVKTPATIPKTGEEFTVYVDISGNPGLRAIQYTLGFDRELLDCTDARMSKLFRGAVSGGNPSAPDGAIIAAVYTDAVTDDGTVAVYQFTAKKDVTAFDFTISELMMTDEENNKITPTVGNAAYQQDEPKAEPAQQTAEGYSGDLAQSLPAGQAQSAGEQTATTAASFPDAKGHWGEAWIAKAAERGLFAGDDKGNFRPDDKITRGDYVLVLWRMADKPEPKNAASFADVPADAYYAKAVAWAYEQGFVNGKGDGFAPADSLTRQEAMKILFGYAGSPMGMERMFTSDYDSAFTDSGSIASWAKSAMYWAYYEGIINGVSANALAPEATATRAQLAKILVGYLDKQS